MKNEDHELEMKVMNYIGDTTNKFAQVKVISKAVVEHGNATSVLVTYDILAPYVQMKGVAELMVTPTVIAYNISHIVGNTQVVYNLSDFFVDNDDGNEWLEVTAFFVAQSIALHLFAE